MASYLRICQCRVKAKCWLRCKMRASAPIHNGETIGYIVILNGGEYLRLPEVELSPHLQRWFDMAQSSAESLLLSRLVVEIPLGILRLCLLPPRSMCLLLHQYLVVAVK